MSNQASKDAYKQGILSIIANLLLFVAKYYAGIMSGSVAIITDAWHTLSDSTSSLILIIGNKLANKPADKEHPFGHGRIELITALIIGILLALVGFNFLISSIDKLVKGESANFGTLAIVVTIASVIINEALAQYAFFLSRKTGNQSLRADGWHHRSDGLSSFIILVGILIGGYWWWMDGALGIIMAGFIFYAAYDIFKEVVNPLIGQQPDEEMIVKIQEISSRIAEKDVSPHHFHIHTYGSHTELTFHIALDGDLCLSDAHLIADKIEKKVNETFSVETTIHIEPTGEDHTVKDIAEDNLNH
ncbi:MAG: cation diffusion facilitator family transporter [Bacteroidota bacterium]